jgi:ATP-dependent protease Clp ATPase subunit
MKPKDVKLFLDKYVIRQDEAKKVLSVALCDHYNHIRRCNEDPTNASKHHVKPNILLVGPTGVGPFICMCVGLLRPRPCAAGQAKLT